MPIITLRSDAFFVPAFLSSAEGPSIEILDEGVLHRPTWLDEVLRLEERRNSIAAVEAG